MKFLIVLIAIIFAACSDDEPQSAANPTPDMQAADTSFDLNDHVDMSNDTSNAPDALVDMGPTCRRPAPMVAGTRDTDLVADSPARCGMPEYQWVRSDELGDIVEFGDSQSLRANAIAAAAELGGIALPREPIYDVVIDQVAYKTQDRGAIVEATTLIAHPENFEAESAEIIVLLHGTTGFNDSCSPSETQEQRILSAAFASFGYIVVAPDFIGLKGFGNPTGFKHPYLVGEATAIATLDAVRAVYELEPEFISGLCPSTEFAMFGGSQGGHAVHWVDRLAPYYARELTPLGGVAAVPPTDLLAQVDRALDTAVRATANTVGFYGSATEWYGYEDELGEVFVEPFDVDIPSALATSCDGDGFETPQSLTELFTPEMLQAAGEDALADYGFAGCMLAENSLTDTSIERIPSALPSYGILNILGEVDDLVHTPIERQSYRTYCEQRLPIWYLECAGGGHVDTIFWSFEEILTFLEERFDKVVFEAAEDCEVPAPVTCSGTP